MTDLERARAVFMKTTFAASLVGCTIEAVGPGYAKCALALGPQHRNALGAPMGGAIFTLADFSFGVASNFDRDVFVSTAADVHFIAEARGGVLIAEAREIRSGRRTCLFSVEITDEHGTRAAYMTISGMLVRERKKKIP